MLSNFYQLMFVQKDIHLLFRCGKKSVGAFFFCWTVSYSFEQLKKIRVGALITRISCGRAISSKKKNTGIMCQSETLCTVKGVCCCMIVHSTWPVEYLNILDHSTFDKIACFWLDEIMFNPKLYSPGVSLCGLGANPGVDAFVGWVCCWFSPLPRQVFL